jgi:hypothetical protein
MSASNILFLLAVVLAFGGFAVVLAWGDYQTRSLAK